MFSIIKIINNKTEIDANNVQNKKINKNDVSKSEVNSNIEEIKLEIKKYRDDRVYVTKKIRMGSEARMNKNNMHSIFILNIYTFTLLVYSILAFQYPSSDWIPPVSLIISVGLFGASLFISLFGYREKALAYKMSHLSLTEIESKLDLLYLNDNLDNRTLLANFGLIQNEYIEILSKTENHDHIDYVIFQYSKNNSSVIEYFLYKIKSFLILLLFYSLPLVGIIFYFM